MTVFQVVITEPNVHHLKTLPNRFPLDNDLILANQGIRKATVDNYLIFYTMSKSINSVTSIPILYAQRKWEELL